MPPIHFSRSTVVTTAVLVVLLVAIAGVWLRAFHDDASATATTTLPAPEATTGAASPSPTTATSAPAGLVPDGGPLSVAWIGTVLTAGRGASDADLTFQATVDHALDVDHSVTSSTTLGRLTSPDDLLAAVKSLPASDLYVVELGDYLSPDMSPRDLGSSLGDVLADVRDTAPDAALVCVGQWAGTDDSAGYDTAIEKACAGSGGTFVALSDIYDAPDSRGPAAQQVYSGHADAPMTKSTETDPNDEGSSQIADRLLETLGVAPA